MLPWNERITVLSIYPDAASRDDVARLASELMKSKAEMQEISNQLMDLYELCSETTKPEIYGAILGLHEKIETTLKPQPKR